MKLTNQGKPSRKIRTKGHQVVEQRLALFLRTGPLGESNGIALIGASDLNRSQTPDKGCKVRAIYRKYSHTNKESVFQLGLLEAQ